MFMNFKVSASEFRKQRFTTATDRIESRELASQVDNQDNNDWLPVAAFLEKIMDGDTALSVRSLLFHLFQLSEYLVCSASQPQQGCRVKTLTDNTFFNEAFEV